MRLPPRIRSAAPPAIWFTALGLVVAGPLLAFSGYLLLLDWPSGPEFPRVDWFPLPSSGALGNATPLHAIHATLRDIHDYLPDKVFLLAPILLGGLGVYRLVRLRSGVGQLAGIFGGTLYSVNPFVTDRYLSGHLYLLIGYGLLPWAVSSLWRGVEEPSPRRGVPVAMWLGVLGVVDIHIAGMFAALVLIAMPLALGRWKQRLAFGGMALGVASLGSAFWLLPALFHVASPLIGLADLEIYASRPRGLGVLPTLLAMDGFWRSEFAGAIDHVPALRLMLIPVLGLAILGGWRLTNIHRRPAGLLAIGMVAALFFAAGVSFPPTSDVFRWLFETMPPLAVYREPQKWLAVVVLGYGVFGAVGIDGLVARASRPGIRVGVAGVAIACVLALGHTMMWGLGNRSFLARYPNDWTVAARLMSVAEPGRLLVTPWHLYAVWSFSNGRIVVNPGPSFFSGDVVSSSEAGFETVPVQSPDPFREYVRRVLSRRREIRWLGHLLAPLGVRYVVSLTEADHWEYGFLHRQKDLRLLYQGQRLTLWSNDAWRGRVWGLHSEDVSESLDSILGTDAERSVTARLIEDPPLTIKAPTQFVPLARGLPGWAQVAPSSSPFVVTSHRCTDGWVLGHSRLRCHLGAAAAFESSSGREILWRPLVGSRLVGWIITGIALIAGGVAYGRSRDVSLPPFKGRCGVELRVSP